MRHLIRIENLTRQLVLADRGELAANPWRRLKGLLGRDGLEAGQALLIKPCQGVHTWFMRFPIDVLHVDRQGVVLRVLEALPPNQLGPLVWQSAYVVELPAGASRRSGTRPGDRLRVA